MGFISKLIYKYKKNHMDKYEPCSILGVPFGIPTETFYKNLKPKGFEYVSGKINYTLFLSNRSMAVTGMFGKYLDEDVIITQATNSRLVDAVVIYFVNQINSYSFDAKKIDEARRVVITKKFKEKFKNFFADAFFMDNGESLWIYDNPTYIKMMQEERAYEQEKAHKEQVEEEKKIKNLENIEI